MREGAKKWVKQRLFLVDSCLKNKELELDFYAAENENPEGFIQQAHAGEEFPHNIEVQRRYNRLSIIERQVDDWSSRIRVEYVTVSNEQDREYVQRIINESEDFILQINEI